MVAPTVPSIRRPLMYQDWRVLTFLHWRYPVDTVQRLLPPGLTVDSWNGEAWVGLVTLLMDAVRAPGVPPLPWLSRFPETNVRTYVRGPDGQTGIWFFSLDAARLPAVVAGRAGFALPYYWSTMSVRQADGAIAYHSRRRWPAPAGAYCDAQVELGDPIGDDDLGALDAFLTARFRLYAYRRGVLTALDAAHPPWPLCHAWLGHLRQNLLTVAGLPAPDEPPLMHASSGVRVRLGGTHRVG